MNAVDVKDYVTSRVIELLHKETLDTYRVRNNNVFTSLIETQEIIQRCSEMKVKTFETVKALVNETIELLKADNCLSFRTYSRELLVQEIKDFLEKNADKLPTKMPEVNRIQFCLRKCIEENKESYLSNLLAALDKMLQECSCWNDNEMSVYIEQLDAIVCALSVQLIYEGYSKQYLFLELKYKAASFDDFYKCIKDLAKKKMHSFEVIWRLRIAEEDAAKLVPLGFKTEVNEEHMDEYAKNKYARRIAPSPNTFFIKKR